MKNKQILVGSILHYTLLVLQTLSAFALTPFIISRLGDGTFGIYRITVSIVAYMGVLNFGFGNATLRFLTEIRANNDIKREKEFLTVVKMFNLAAVGLAILAGFVLYLFIPRVFIGSLSAKEIIIARNMFTILVFSVVINIFNDIYIAVIMTHERFIFLRSLDLVRCILRVFLLFLILSFHPAATSLVMIDLVMSIVAISSNITYSRIKLNIRLKYSTSVLRALDKGYYKPVIIYATLFLLNLIMDQLIWNTNPIIIGMRLSSFDAAIYGVATTISTTFYQCSYVIGNLMFPTIVRLVSSGANQQEFTDVTIHMGRIQAFIAMLIITAFFVCGRQFISLWLGSSYQAAWVSSMLIMAGTLFNSLITTGYLILRAMNKQLFFLCTYTAVFIINAFVTYTIITTYGIVSAAASTFISYGIITLCLIMPYLYKTIGLDIKLYLKNIILPIGIPMALAAPFYYIYKKISFDSWLKLVTGIIGYILFYCILLFVLVLKKEEKKLIYNTFCKRA